MLSEPEVAESKASSKKYVKYSFLTVMLLMDQQGGFQGTETASPVSLFDFFSSAYFNTQLNFVGVTPHLEIPWS